MTGRTHRELIFTDAKLAAHTVPAGTRVSITLNGRYMTLRVPGKGLHVLDAAVLPALSPR
jgi:hypothetical protein